MSEATTEEATDWSDENWWATGACWVTGLACAIAGLPGWLNAVAASQLKAEPMHWLLLLPVACAMGGARLAASRTKTKLRALTLGAATGGWAWTLGVAPAVMWWAQQRVWAESDWPAGYNHPAMAEILVDGLGSTLVWTNISLLFMVGLGTLVAGLSSRGARWALQSRPQYLIGTTFLATRSGMVFTSLAIPMAALTRSVAAVNDSGLPGLHLFLTIHVCLATIGIGLVFDAGAKLLRTGWPGLGALHLALLPALTAVPLFSYWLADPASWYFVVPTIFGPLLGAVLALSDRRRESPHGYPAELFWVCAACMPFFSASAIYGLAVGLGSVGSLATLAGGGPPEAQPWRFYGLAALMWAMALPLDPTLAIPAAAIWRRNRKASGSTVSTEAPK